MGNCIDSDERKEDLPGYDDDEEPPDWEDPSKIKQFSATCVHECHNQLGKSVVWCPKKSKLYWLDLEKRELWSYDPKVEDIRHQRVEMGSSGSCVALRHNGGFVICSSTGVGLLDPVELDETKPPLVPREICHPIKSESLNTDDVMLNDGRVDPDGRLVVGAYHKTLSSGKQDAEELSKLKRDPRGHVYRITTNTGFFGMGIYGEYMALKDLGAVSCADGIAFGKHDGRDVMYLVDTPTCNVQCFDYSDWKLPKLLDVSTPELHTAGRPCGGCVDAQGGYWVAEDGAGRIVRIHNNEVTAMVTVDAPSVTGCTFGGPDLDILYITTAVRGDPSPTEKAGGLFQCKIPAIHGYPERYFDS